jgi:hypothetical protein
MWLLYLHFEFFLVSTYAKDISLAQELFYAIILSSKYNLFVASTYQYPEKILLL